MESTSASGTEKCYLLVTSYGSDRPGIVDDLTAWFLEHEGNVEESRMARLGSEFASLVLVSGPADLEARLAASRREFEQRAHLSVVLKRVAPLCATGQPTLRYRLEATALDHPGIVQRIAHVLRAHDVNIAEVQTHIEQAPFTSAPIFRVSMEVDVPAHTVVGQLRAQLLRTAETAGIDIDFRPA